MAPQVAGVLRPRVGLAPRARLTASTAAGRAVLVRRDRPHPDVRPGRAAVTVGSIAAPPGVARRTPGLWTGPGVGAQEPDAVDPPAVEPPLPALAALTATA